VTAKLPDQLPPLTGQFLSEDVACKILGVHPRTLKRWAERRHNPLPLASICPGGKRYIIASDLEAWIRSHVRRDVPSGRPSRKAKGGAP
jgi:hypothetical protein